MSGQKENKGTHAFDEHGYDLRGLSEQRVSGDWLQDTVLDPVCIFLLEEHVVAMCLRRMGN